MEIHSKVAEAEVLVVQVQGQMVVLESSPLLRELLLTMQVVVAVVDQIVLEVKMDSCQGQGV